MNLFEDTAILELNPLDSYRLIIIPKVRQVAMYLQPCSDEICLF